MHLKKMFINLYFAVQNQINKKYVFSKHYRDMDLKYCVDSQYFNYSCKIAAYHVTMLHYLILGAPETATSCYK